MVFELIQRQILKIGLILKRNAIGLLLNQFTGSILRKRKSLKAQELPPWLMIEPTNDCTLKCPTCPTGGGYGTRKKAVMSLATFKDIVSQVENSVMSIALFNYGEPFLNKNLTEMIAYAAKKNIWVWTSTNGIALKDITLASDVVRSKLHSIVICLDGASDETLNKFRKGAKFSDIIDGIKNLVEMKKTYKSLTPFIEIQFILMKHNSHEVDKIKRIAKELGVKRVLIKTVGISLADPKLELKIKTLCPDTSFESSIEKIPGVGYRFTVEHNGKCPNLYRLLVINADGDVVPCCYDLKGEYVMGNIHNEKLETIWNGHIYQRFREEFLNAPDRIPMCNICPEGRVQSWK